MAEGFVLNISKEMLQRLDAADKKIVQIGESAEKAMKKINEAFGKKLTGVEDFIKQLNDIQQQLTKKDLKVNVDLALKNGALDSLKKQIEALGITIPVGVTGTGSNASGSVPNLQSLLDSIVKITTNLESMIKNFPFGKNVEAAVYTPNQIETLNKRARATLYRGELNALTELSNKEKERRRNLREQDKENQSRHRERLNQIKIEEARNKLKVKAEIDELKRLANAYKQMPTTINTKQVGNLIAQSKQSQSVNQRLIAIKNLKNAIKDLDTTDSRYQRTINHLNKEIRRQESELKKLGYQLDNVNKQSRHLFDITGQLGRALSLMFSVSQITQYISKMVNVRKEMELQQRSLQVLLQNKDKANELWNQTLDLAVKSPFRVKELVTYTKQLAAYRIESEKLFETNKMLADVSAGLGVDMQRLILAFGQVKAASFLRGTELRQFTEAGIPMLEELAKYFGEIQGRAISVAEVFDMISKRMVTFADVEKVFQRMTGAGGVFFNMQEELSQTTAGMISNFHDSVDLMFNEMGKKNQGLVNNFIKAARYLVDNWETVGMVIKQVLQSLIFWKTTTFLINKDVDVYIKLLLQSKGILKTLLTDLKGGFANIMKGLKSGIKGGWISVAITGVIFLITKLIARQQKIKKEIEDTTKRYKEFADTVKDLNVEFSRLEGGNLEEYQEKLSTLVQLAERDYHIEVDFEVKNLKDIDEVKAKFSELEMQMMRMNNFALNFELSYTDLSHRGLSELWDEDINKDINQLSDSYSALYNNIRGDMNDLLYLLNHAEKPLNEAQKKIVNALNPIGDTETERDYFKRLISVYPLIEDVYGDTYRALEDRIEDLAPYRFNELYGFDIVTLRKLYEGYIDDLKEAEKESAKLFEKHSKEIANTITFEGLSGEQATTRAEELINYALKRLALEKEWNEYTLDEMRAFANEYFGDKYTGFNISPVIEPKEPFKGLKSWQQEYNKFIEDYSKTLKEAHDELDETDEIILGALPIAEDEQGYATTQRKKLKEIKELLEDERELLKQATDENGKVIDSFAESFDLEASKTKISLLEMLWKWLGGEEDDNSKGKMCNIIKDQINLIKQLYEEYQKLSKEMSATEARSKVRSGFADAADEYGLNIAGIDFTNLQGVLEALQTLVPQAQAAGKDAMQELSKSIGETKVELELLAYVKAREDFDDKIKEMFSGYEISLELDKLDIPADWAKTFFGVETKSLEEIQSVLNERQTEIDKANEINSKALEKYKKDYLTEEEKIIKEALEKQIAGYKEESAIISNNEAKIQELIEKEQQKRLETYLNYARKSIGERAKLKLEEYNTLLDIEQTFKEQQDKIDQTEYTDEEKERQKKLNEQVKKDAIANVEKKSKEKMDKLEWEEFQKTDTFINLFRDLENASETMLESTLGKLQEFKNQWVDMPLEDMKQVIEKINELEIALANLSPRDTIKESKEKLNKYIEEKQIKGDYSDVIANLQKENFGFETENLNLEKVISNLEVYFRLLEEGKREQANKFYTTHLPEQQSIQGVDEDGKQVTVDLSKQTKLTREQLELLRNKVELNKDNITINQTLLSDAEKLKNAYLKQAENIGQVQQVVGQLKNGFDSVVEAAAALGADTEDIELFGNMANDIISSTLGMVQLQLQLKAAEVAATGFGAAMNMAFGVIGWIVLAVQSIAKAISAIAKSKDNKLVKEIEEQQRKIENLQKTYEVLDEKIDDAWSVSQLQKYHRELKSTTEALITAQKAVIAAQEQRKKSSEVGSDEWKELQDLYATLDELEKRLEDTEKDIFSKITGNIMDDILGVTESFVDAWYDAFKKTGDGLKGLEDNFDEMLLNLVKRQAAMQLAEQFVSEWQKVLQQYSEGGLTPSEIKSWADIIKADLPDVSSFLKEFYKSFEDMYENAGDLSGLQRGVTEIQESTAQELASYLNSIRFIVSDSNAQLKLLVSAQTGANTRSENPMVEQLRVIAQQTSAINTLLNSLTAPHPTLSGRGLKVVI